MALPLLLLLCTIVLRATAEGNCDLFPAEVDDCSDQCDLDVRSAPTIDLPADSANPATIFLNLPERGVINLSQFGYTDCLGGSMTLQPGLIVTYTVPEGTTQLVVTTCNGEGNDIDSEIALYLPDDIGTCLALSPGTDGCATVTYDIPAPLRRLEEGRRLQGLQAGNPVQIAVVAPGPVTLTVAAISQTNVKFCRRIEKGDFDHILGKKVRNEVRKQCYLLGIISASALPEDLENTMPGAPFMLLALACLAIGSMVFVTVRVSRRWARRATATAASVYDPICEMETAVAE